MLHYGISNRDTEDNPGPSFRKKRAYPVKSDGNPDMDRRLMHLICMEIIEEDETGREYSKRIFDNGRSMRLLDTASRRRTVTR